MIPNIFVSSTVQDLQYLRDAIRDQIIEIGYNPVMSDYGEVGYLPTTSAENSCYLSMKECQIAVLIIGKKYSGLATEGLSVTHNEYLIAKKHTIPVICLVDRDVITFKKVYDHIKDEKEVNSFPEMDNPKKTFELVNDFKDSKVNNGYLPFSNAGEAMSHLKNQLAHIYGQLLRDRFDPLAGSIKDVLSEIKTLKHELLKDKKKTAEYEPFLRGMRLLLDDENNSLQILLHIIYDNLEEGVVNILKNNKLDELIYNSGYKIELTKGQIVSDGKEKPEFKYDIAFKNEHTFYSDGQENKIILSLAINKEDKIIITNSISIEALERMFEKIKLITIGCA